MECTSKKYLPLPFSIRLFFLFIHIFKQRPFALKSKSRPKWKALQFLAHNLKIRSSEYLACAGFYRCGRCSSWKWCSVDKTRWFKPNLDLTSCGSLASLPLQVNIQATVNSISQSKQEEFTFCWSGHRWGLGGWGWGDKHLSSNFTWAWMWV